MARNKLNSKKKITPSQPQPAAVMNVSAVVEKDYYAAFQERIDQLIKAHPTTVIPYFKKDDVIRVLKSIATAYQPTPDDPDLSLSTEVSVGSILYEIGCLLTFSVNEMRELVGNEVLDDLYLPKDIRILLPQ